ncbi:MAG: alginate lyase family protein [Balneolaceae bacterium]|nr:alginate lyase family protein [Balneolaceae bacterium]
MKRILQTLAYVTPKQAFFRLKYLLAPVQSLKIKNYRSKEKVTPIQCLPIPPSKKIIEKTGAGYHVTLLNLSTKYENQIQWADNSYGQLWNYHLQYADFLKQDDLSVTEKEDLLIDLYEWLKSGKLKPEPYPSSLRIMNLIRFLSENQEDLNKKNELIDHLYSELLFLENQLEYHLLGNHLMENAFALLMGGTYFQNDRWKNVANAIFLEQVAEQILKDGGHFERSPMYHLILLFRFLEALYYLPSDSELYSLFLKTSKQMLVWIDQMSFRNGDLAHFNDSTDHQAYSKKQILRMAQKCGITEYSAIILNDSGYRRFENENASLLVDACGIKPDYQPGHAHADSLSFILYSHGKPIVIDPGVSTYEDGKRRNWERSTKAHNTVTFRQQNTADVWGKFRVGKRPNVKIVEESDAECKLRLRHKLKSGDLFEHHRKFHFSHEFVEIFDSVTLNKIVEGRLHLHPSIKIKELTKNRVILYEGTVIKLQNILLIEEFTYKCSNAFNVRINSTGIRYEFERDATLRIYFPGT